MKKFAFVFPGQGSQAVGMLDGWGDSAIVKTVLDEASQALDQDLAELIHSGSKEDLALTVNTQPVMLVAGVAAYRVWMDEVNVAPSLVAGHSLGEYAALVAAGSLTLVDAVRLVRLRAQAMQEAVPAGAGAMAAILGLDAEKVVTICQTVSALQMAEPVDAVNFNDTTQTVIAGSKIAVEAACEELKKAGAKRALLLPVSAPFHSSLMKPAAEKLKIALAKIVIGVPQIPVLNNVDVSIENEPSVIADALYRQAFHPVRWVEIIQKMGDMGVEAVVECGPGKVLSGLTKRINAQMINQAVFDAASLQIALEVLANH